MNDKSSLVVGIFVILGLIASVCAVLVSNVQMITFLTYYNTVSGISVYDILESSNIINTIYAFGGPLSIGVSLLDVFSPNWWINYHILIYFLKGF
ncbi:MAG: hypothetical protein ACTSSA_10175 [Candidatus Freyarchaeota archaeon]|nr:hypothetical protein [Candidatus Freyarchaeota archaeon]